MRGGREKKGHMWEGLCSMLKEWDGLTLINTAAAALWSWIYYQVTTFLLLLPPYL